MVNAQPSFGVIGLGKMGAGIVRHALSKGYRVVGLDERTADDLRDDHFIEARDIREFGTLLQPARIVFLYIPLRRRRRNCQLASTSSVMRDCRCRPKGAVIAIADLRLISRSLLGGLLRSMTRAVAAGARHVLSLVPTVSRAMFAGWVILPIRYKERSSSRSVGSTLMQHTSHHRVEGACCV